MHSIGSALVILAGCGTLVSAAFVRHGDTSVFLSFVGVGVGVVGLWGFVSSIRNGRNESR